MKREGRGRGLSFRSHVQLFIPTALMSTHCVTSPVFALGREGYHLYTWGRVGQGCQLLSPQ